MTRLPPRASELIDRARTLEFEFDGRPVAALEGDTIDTQPDRMVLPLPANQLAGLFLAVDGFLSPIRITGKNQKYSLEIHLRQNGATVGEGPVVVSGDMHSTIPILEYVEL